MQTILESLEQQVRPQHTALVIIDPQKDFCDESGGMAKLMGWDVTRFEPVIKKLNSFIEKTREMRVMIVWVRSLADSRAARASYSARKFRQGAIAKNITVVKEGTEGAEWCSAIHKPLPTEHVVTKWHYDAFEDTNLSLLLAANAIKTILFAGFATNICVETAIRRAYIQGYYCVALDDCTNAPSAREYESSIFNIENYFGKVASSEEIISIWHK
jgi:nicotinamidase-related amidase